MVLFVLVSGCLVNSDNEIVAKFKKKKDPFLSEKDARKNSSSTTSDEREEIDSSLELIYPAYSPASTGDFSFKVSGGIIVGDLISVYGDETCSSELSDFSVVVEDVNSAIVFITNVAVGSFSGAIRVSNSDDFLGNCLPINYTHLKTLPELSGIFPDVGGRQLNFSLASVKAGEKISVYSDSDCNNLIGESLVTSEEASFDKKNLSLSFDENAIGGNYNIYYKVTYLDETISNCSTESLGNYELDLNPPDNPSLFSFSNSSPSNSIQNPVIDIEGLPGNENIIAQIYLNDDSCSQNEALYGENTSADTSISITGNLIQSAGEYNFYASLSDLYGNKSDCVLVTPSYIYDNIPPAAELKFVGTDLPNISGDLTNIDLAIISLDEDLVESSLYWKKVGHVSNCSGLTLGEMEKTSVVDLNNSISSMNDVDLSGVIDGGPFIDGEILCLKLHQTDLASNEFLSSGLTITHSTPINLINVLDAEFASSETSCVSDENLNFIETCQGQIIRPVFELIFKSDGYMNDSSYVTITIDGEVIGENLSPETNEVIAGNTGKLSFQLQRGKLNAPGDQLIFDFYQNGNLIHDNFLSYFVTPIDELVAQEKSVVESLGPAVDTGDAPGILALKDTCTSLGLKYREATGSGFCSMRPGVTNEVDCDTSWVNLGSAGCDSYTIAKHLDGQMCVSDSICMIIDSAKMTGGLSASGTKEIVCLSNNLYAQSGNDKYANNLGISSGPYSTWMVGLSEGEIPHKVFCGRRYNCTLLTSGLMKCWGFGGSALGQPFNSRIGRKSSEFKLLNNTIFEGHNSKYNGDLRPIEMPNGVFVKDMATSWHSCAISTAGNLFCFGSNDYGKLGYTKSNLEAYGIIFNNEYTDFENDNFPPVGGYNIAQDFSNTQVNEVASKSILNDLAKGYFDNTTSTCYLREYNQLSCEANGGSFTPLFTTVDNRIFFHELVNELDCVSHGGSWESDTCRSQATICTSNLITESDCESNFEVKDVEVSSTHNTCAIFHNSSSGEDHVRCFGDDDYNGTLGIYQSISTLNLSNNIGDLGLISRSGAVDADLKSRLTGCYKNYAKGFCEQSGGQLFDSSTITNWFDGFSQGGDYTEIPEISASYCRYPENIDTENECLEKSFYVPPSSVVGLFTMDKIDKLVSGRSYYCAHNEGTLDYRCWGDGLTGTLHEGVSYNISSLIYLPEIDDYSLANDLTDFGEFYVCKENVNCSTVNGNDTSSSLVDSNATIHGFGSSLCFKGESQINCMGANSSAVFADQDIFPTNQFNALGVIDHTENPIIDFYSTDFVYHYKNRLSAYSGMISFYQNDAIMEFSCGYFGDDSNEAPKIKCWGYDLNDELGAINKFHSGKYFSGYDKSILLDDGGSVAGQRINLDSNSIAVFSNSLKTNEERVNLLQSSTRIFESNGTVTEIIAPRYFSKNIVGDNFALSPYRLNSSYVGNKFDDDFMLGWVVESPQYISCGSDNLLTFNITGTDIVLSSCSDGVSQTEAACGVNTWTSNCNKYFSSSEIVELINIKNGSNIISFSKEASKYYVYGDASEVVIDLDSNILLQLGYNAAQTVASATNPLFGWSHPNSDAFNLVEYNACLNPVINNESDCTTSSGLWNSTEEKCFIPAYSNYNSCLNQAGHQWFEKLHDEIGFGCIDSSIVTKVDCDNAKSLNGKCFRAGVDVSSTFSDYDQCLGQFDNDSSGCEAVGGTFIDNGVSVDHCINAPGQNYWVSDYWGWQDRSNHLFAGRGLCHQSFSNGTPFNKTNCTGGNLKWIGEIGSACYHSLNNAYKSISTNIALDSCIDYHPFFDNE